MTGQNDMAANAQKGGGSDESTMRRYEVYLKERATLGERSGKVNPSTKRY